MAIYRQTTELVYMACNRPGSLERACQVVWSGGCCIRGCVVRLHGEQLGVSYSSWTSTSSSTQTERCCLLLTEVGISDREMVRDVSCSCGDWSSALVTRSRVWPCCVLCQAARR